jgi:alpha-mannosidase
VEVSAPNVVASSLKPARDGRIALRLYESAGRPASTTVKLSADLAEASEADLLETEGKALDLADGAFRVELTPYQIKTIVLRAGPSR